MESEIPSLSSSENESEIDINILEYMNSKEKLKIEELCIYFQTILKNIIKVNEENNSYINDYIDSVTNINDLFKKNSIDELQSMHKEHLEIIKTFEKNISIVNKNKELLSSDINSAFIHFNNNSILKTHLDNIYSEKVKDIMISCNFKNLCELCASTTIYATDLKDKYCFHCKECDNFRKYSREHIKTKKKKNLHQQLDEEYNRKYPPIKKSKKITLPTQVNINNTYVNINLNQNIYTQQTIITKDRFFEVFITVDGNDIEKLKHLFIYYMCRMKAVELYPDEKHNIISSYPLSAALYTIRNNVLHGILRYKHSKADRMTINKLKKITNNKIYNINVNQITSIENIKNNFSTEKLSSVINSITNTNSYGSLIDDFYISDLIN